MEKIKDTIAASYNLDGNLFLQPKLRPLGAFVILFHLFGTFQSKKTKIFCFEFQFESLKPKSFRGDAKKMQNKIKAAISLFPHMWGTFGGQT